jgi:Zn-dependent oligopeptidase
MKRAMLMMLFFACNFLEAGKMESGYHPFLANDDPINWHRLSPKYIEEDVKLAIELAQKNIDAIASLPLHKLTFKNTILALERASEPLSIAWKYVGHLDSTCNSDELRAEQNKMLPHVAEFGANILLNDDLWTRIKTFAETDEAKGLVGVDRKMLEHTIDGFHDSGADLPRKKRERIKEIKIEMSKLSKKFSENVLDSRNAWEKYVDSIENLAGLPQITIDVLGKDAKKHGHGSDRISLDPSSSVKFMQYLDDGKFLLGTKKSRHFCQAL